MPIPPSSADVCWPGLPPLLQVIDMCNALDIEPVVTLAYDSNDAGDWADLIE